jgi:hypothetical protein
MTIKRSSNRLMAGDSSSPGGCTQAFAIGLTALLGNMNGQCVDSPVTYWPRYLTLVIPSSGNRYLMVGDGSIFPLMNDKGIILSGGGRVARQFAPYPGKAHYRPKTELLRTCNSAAEFVKIWSETHTKYGSPHGSSCTLVVDTREGYCLEGANFVYGDRANHAIHGPMTDQVFVSANFFISRRLKTMAEEGIGAGYTRAGRLWQLLIDRQYDCVTMQPSRPANTGDKMPPFVRGGGITPAYFMQCLRDHGNINPREGKNSCYVPEERGQGALCCHGLWEYTTNAYFGISRTEYTDLFTCEWITPNQPCISPFLPIYIGINELPRSWSTSEGFDHFERLRAQMDFHPEYRDRITEYWTGFEIRTIEESTLAEARADKLADAGDKNGARTVLTEFVTEKSNEAMTDCQTMLDFLDDLPILEKFQRKDVIH